MTIIVSGNDDPMAATTAPAALRVNPRIDANHSTAFVNASLASTTKTSAPRTPAAVCTGRRFSPRPTRSSADAPME